MYQLLIQGAKWSTLATSRQKGSLPFHYQSSTYSFISNENKMSGLNKKSLQCHRVIINTLFCLEGYNVTTHNSTVYLIFLTKNICCFSLSHINFFCPSHIILKLMSYCNLKTYLNPENGHFVCKCNVTYNYPPLILTWIECCGVNRHLVTVYFYKKKIILSIK